MDVPIMANKMVADKPMSSRVRFDVMSLHPPVFLHPISIANLHCSRALALVVLLDRPRRVHVALADHEDLREHQTPLIRQVPPLTSPRVASQQLFAPQRSFPRC